MKLDEEGHIVSTIVVENDTSDIDTINQIHLAETEPDAEGGVSFLSSIPQVDVVLPPGEGWEGNFTWGLDASNKAKQLGAVMVMAEFEHSQAVGNAFMIADIQDESSGGGGFWQRAQSIGWALLIAGLAVGVYGEAQSYLHPQQTGEISTAVESLLPAAPPYPYGSAQSVINASYYGQIKVVEKLLDQGVDVNAIYKNGMTALMAASQAGHIETVKLLLDKGANVNTMDNDGGTALMIACQEGHADMVKLLLDKGADVDVKDSDGGTALMIASQEGRTDSVKLCWRGAQNPMLKTGTAGQF